MRKLTATTLKSRDKIIAALRETYTALEEAVEAYNAAAEELWGKVEEAREPYESALDEAREWLAEQVEAMEEYVGERSEKWQESDAADIYREWKQQFEDIEVADLDLDTPAHVEYNANGDLPDQLEELPEQPE